MTCGFTGPTTANRPWVRRWGDGAVRVERFGLTANNLTYRCFRRLVRLLQFFPRAGGLGRIPVWGFGAESVSGVDGIVPATASTATGDVSLSRCARVPNALARRVVGGGAPPLPPVYNHYLRRDPEAASSPAG